MKISLQNLLTKKKNEWLKEQWEKNEQREKKITYIKKKKEKKEIFKKKIHHIR